MAAQLCEYTKNYTNCTLQMHEFCFHKFPVEFIAEFISSRIYYHVFLLILYWTAAMKLKDAYSLEGKL